MSLDISRLITKYGPIVADQTNISDGGDSKQTNKSVFPNLSSQENTDIGGKNSKQSNNNILSTATQKNNNILGEDVTQSNTSIASPTGLESFIQKILSNMFQSMFNLNTTSDTTTSDTKTDADIAAGGCTTGSTTDDTTTGEDTTIPDDSKGAWGDPHYHLKGEDGNDIKFDHKGKDNHTYNVFKGDNFQVDGKYVPYAKDPDNPQVIGKARVTAGEDVITFDKKGVASLNDKTLKAGEYDLKDGTHVKYRDKQIILNSPEKDSNIKLKAESSGITVDPSGKFTDTDGIIGKAVTENKKLTKEEAENFDVTSQRPIK